MVKNLPSNAGDLGLIPGRGTKIPHAAGQLCPHATTTEFMRLNKRARVLQTTEPTCPGACTPQLERKPTRHSYREACAPQLEKPAHGNERSRTPQRRSRVLQLRPNAAKKRKKKKVV